MVTFDAASQYSYMIETSDNDRDVLFTAIAAPSSSSPMSPHFLWSGLVILSILAYQVSALWPIPRTMSPGNHPVKLSSEFDIHVHFANPPADLRAAISRTKSSLFSGKLGRLVLGRGSADAHLLKDARTLVSLELSLAAGSPVRSIAEETNQPIEAKSESYSLSIPENNASATISANSTLGLFRGLATFEQLWYDYEGTKYTLEGGAEINDGPAFVSTFKHASSADYFAHVSSAISRVLLRYRSQFVRSATTEMVQR